MDTGRVLLVQRQPDKHDDDSCYARWEVPGGRLDGGHEGGTDPSVYAGALREWSEETGATLDAEPCGGWIDGTYEGFVVRIPREADLSLSPQLEEVSRVAWWAPEDLEDPEVRDKVQEQLGDISPLLKADWSDFHRHTDKILDAYDQEIRDALASSLEGDAVRNAARAAYTAEKATPQQQLNAAAPAVVGAGAVGAAGAGVLGAAIAGTGVLGAALLALWAAPRALKALRKVIARLYAEGYLQGALEASKVAGGKLHPKARVSLPNGYFENWEQGTAEQVLADPPPSLRKLLDELGVRLEGISDTQVSRIESAITHAVGSGSTDLDALTHEIDSIISDPKRARLIAETEYARAFTAAVRETYRQNNVGMIAWEHQPGACARCMENAAVSPISIHDSWPSGNVPVHPACRCAEVPA